MKYLRGMQRQPVNVVARMHFVTTLFIFAANGLQAGIFTVLIADVATALQLSASALGMALAVFSGMSLLGVSIGGRLSDQRGRRFVLVLGMIGTGIFYLLLGIVNSYAMLLAVVVFGGLLLSLFDLSYPSLGSAYEQQYRVSAMTQLYAGFDGANALGALGCGIALTLGVAYGAIYAVLGVLLLVGAVVSLWLPFPEQTARQHSETHKRPTQSPNLLRTRGVVLAMVFVGLIALIDAALEGYTSIYLRDVLQSGPLLAGAAIAAASIASLCGRLGNVVVIRRLGERNALIGGGVGTALGIAVLVATPVPMIAAAGLLVLHAFEAPIVPVSFSLAARSVPERTGAAASVVWGTFYVAFILGPLIVGTIADMVGLQATLALFILTSLGIAGIAYTKLR